MPKTESKLPSLQPVYWIAALAFALRAAARLRTGAADFWVNGYYFYFAMARDIAAGKGICDGGGVPSASRVPLYPILLAGLTQGRQVFWPVLITECLIGACIAVCAALMARQMFPAPVAGRAASLAAAITAVYPYYVIHDTALQETSLFTLLTLVAVLAVQKLDKTGSLVMAPLSGILLGLDVLTRATIAPFAAFVPLWLIWRGRRQGGLVCGLLLALTISPWLWYSYKLTGSAMLSSDTGGLFWNGNNELFFNHYPRESCDVSIDEENAALTEQDRKELATLGNNKADVNRWFVNRGLAYVRTHPWLTVANGLRKIGAGFGWLPSPRRGRWQDLGYLFSYAPVMLLGLWGMWRRRAHWREDSLLYALFFAFAVVTAVFWAHTSHRSYLDVYWIVFASGALSQASLRGLGPRRVAAPGGVS
jgi:4-amino-4-deoxy-L-arabinose transferase-like glycosyltransferase